MAIETTQLRFQKPDGNELLRNGDNVIAANAQKSEDLIQADRTRLDLIESENTAQDGRLTGIESLQPVKAVRLENGKWVWDVADATHYVFPEPGGGLGVHATAWPVPNPTTPSLDW